MWIVVAATATAVSVIVTGVWRILLWPARISPKKMSAERLGFRVSDGADKASVDGVCRAFAMGFNTMISHPSAERWKAVCNGISPMYRPFAHEGAAMGHPVRAVGRFSPELFESDIVCTNTEFAYLHYVGLGFWSAMRNHSPLRMAAVVNKLDPLLGPLFWDGYGFKHGFFDFAATSSYTRKFEQLDGYARHVAYQGLGRSLWFRFMDDVDALIGAIRSFGLYAPDTAAGLGLAAVFATADRPHRGLAVVERLPRAWHADALLGMCFGYKARARCDEAYFAEMLTALDVSRVRAIRAAIAQCDVIEARVRCDGGVDGYRRWRGELRDWLVANVSYPFSALRGDETKNASDPVTVRAARAAG